jgi:outer membrane protein assembly factor BamB/predicted phosphohydrolase
MRFLIKLNLIFIITACICSALYGKDPVNSSAGFSFALLTDLHVSPGSKSDSALNIMVNEINRAQVDFTIVTGDLSNSGTDAELSVVKSALDKLIKPCYVLPGNHETNWSESAGQTFQNLWGNDRFIFSHKGFRMIGFNTGPYMKMGDGHVKQEDLRWLKKNLSEKSDDKLIVFAHYPLSDGLDNWPAVTEILKSSACRLVFCGHGHSLKLLNFDGIPGIMCRSLIMGKSPVPGYSIITLRNDSVLVFNKELNKNPGNPDIGLNYMHPESISELPVSVLPDYAVNKLNTNYKVAAVWSDSASIFSGPCLVNDSIIVYGNSLGYLNALHSGSGKLLWQDKIAGPVYSTPVAEGKIIVLGTVDGKIVGLNGINGELLWEVNTGRPVLAEGIIEDGSVYIGGGDSEFYKIDLENGNILWKFSGIAGLIQGKPALSDSAVVFGAWDRHLYCIDKNTGLLKWKWDNGKPQVLYSPGNILPICSGNRVFIVAPDRFMTALELSTGKEIWRTARHHVRESLGSSPDGSVIYAKLMNDTVIAVPAKDNHFRTIWKANAGFGYEHSPCPVFADKEEVVAGTRDGVIISIDPVTSAVRWKYKAGTSSVNKIVSDGHKMLWLTLTEGRIIGIMSKEHY